MNLHTLVRHSSMNARVLNNLYFSRLKQNISSKKYCGASKAHGESGGTSGEKKQDSFVKG